MSSRTVVHLPVYPENPYQPMLMTEQRNLGWEVIDGGGGGNFFRTALNNWKPDVLHLHWLHPYLLKNTASGTCVRGARFLFEIGLIRRRGAAVVWTVHNLTNHDNKFGQLENMLTRRFVRMCDAIVTHGSVATERAKHSYAINDQTPVLEIPHPSFIDAYPNTVTKHEAREQLGISSSSFVFLFLGRIAPYKQLEKLIASFKVLKQGHAKLLIAGQPSDPVYGTEIALQAASDPRISITQAHIEDAEIQCHMASSDVVVCPSRSILTSGSVALAMSFGRPVIAPTDGCIPESVGDTGILYTHESDETLEWALGRAVERKDELPKLGKLALQRMQDASPSRIAKSIVDLYESVRS